MFGIGTVEVTNISITLRAASHGVGGRMWPPGHQLPMYVLDVGDRHTCALLGLHDTDVNRCGSFL